MHCAVNGTRLAQPRSASQLQDIWDVANGTSTTFYWLGLYQGSAAVDTDENWRFVDGGEFADLLDTNATAAIKLWTFAEPDDASFPFQEQHQQDCAVLNGDVAVNDMDCD